MEKCRVSSQSFWIYQILLKKKKNWTLFSPLIGGFVSDVDANLITIKGHSRRKSVTVAKGYMENLLKNKFKIACQLFSTTSRDNTVSILQYEHKTSLSMNPQRLTISNCFNFTIDV